jgi:acetylornithine deacetylase/succinyl-diaminopimelate desuccinylase-like protein
MSTNLQQVQDDEAGFIDEFWKNHILNHLKKYITLQCVSRHYDGKWKDTLPEAAKLAHNWIQDLKIPGAKVSLETPPKEDNRTPFVLIELPGTVNKTVLFYGHFDKQPAGEGWTETKPWEPVIQNNKLYGRGAVDDGYAVFAAVAAMEALRHQEVPRPRAVICLELDEESGSIDFPFYLNKYSEIIGNPGLLIFLDSGIATYDRLWLTTSLRGLLNWSLSAKVMEAPVHSGGVSGIIPDPVRILRTLLGRLEDDKTGRILPDALHVTIPEERKNEAKQTAQVLGKALYQEFKIVDGLKPVTEDLTELYLNRSWRPQLTVVGQDGLPATASASNVLQPSATLKLSLRLPPTLEPEKAKAVVSSLLTTAPPYGCKVKIDPSTTATGWNASPFPDWLAKALEDTSKTHFGKTFNALQVGGSIGVVNQLADKFSKAQIVMTGASGPESNAHGPHENLDISYAKKLTACVADLVKAFSA